jgi:hypothetical protein
VRRTLLSVAAAACLCSYLIAVVPLIGPRIKSWKESETHYTEMETFLQDAVPEDASVAASAFLLPHIADRDEIYEVYYHKNKPDIEYVVLDARYTADYEKFLAAYTAQGYTIVDRLDNRIVILKQPNQ